MTRALYSGSFDPVTLGHLDVVHRAAAAFDELTVVVGNNPAKKYVFTLEERARFLRHSIRDERVAIRTIQNQLLADYAYEAGISVIVKGVRNMQDYDYERMMHEINITQQRGIDTHILIARTQLNHVSSSAVKELCRYQGFTHEYVPLIVKEALEHRLNGQVIIGLTGGIGCGKSYLGRRLVEVGTARGMQVHNIELDLIAHSLLLDRPEPVYQQLRRDICAEFGLSTTDRKVLGHIIFQDAQKLARLNAMMRVPLLTRVRAEMAGKKGLLLLNSALLAEADLLSLCNNNVILVSATDVVRMERLRARGLSDEQIHRRVSSQFTTEEKRKRIDQAITADRWGRCMPVESNGPWDDRMVQELLAGFPSAPHGCT